MEPISAGIMAAAQLGGAFMSAQGAAAQNAAARERNNMEMQMFNRQNDLNQWYFQKNFENNMYMSGSAYQRAMADMKAAGLNPVLAYQQGGASTNAGSMQSAAGGQLSDPMPANPQAEMGRGISRSVSSALDAMQTTSSIKQLQQQTETERQRSRNVELDNALKIEQTFKTAAEIDQTKANTQLQKGQTSNLDAVQKLLGSQSAQALANAGLAGAQTSATTADAQRKHDYGDGVFGNLANTVDRIQQGARRKVGEGWDAAKDVARKLYGTISQNPTTTVPNPRR